MCLIISGVFIYLSYSFYIDNNLTATLINGTIAIFFIILLIRNIIKSRKYLKEKDTNNKGDK
jgi:hypothetical protein